MFYQYNNKIKKNVFVCLPAHPSQLELRPMVQAGVAGFKCFLIHSGVDEFPHVSDADLHAAMKQLQGTDSVLLVSHLILFCLPNHFNLISDLMTHFCHDELLIITVPRVQYIGT